MNIVLTGASGFIGRCLRRRLEATASPVIAVGRTPDPFDPDLHLCDLSDPARLLPNSHILEEFTLVHLAWVPDRPARFADHAEHVRLLAGLLDYWADRGLRRVVTIGSAEEYGSREGRLHESDRSSGSRSPYGWGKYAACELARDWSARRHIPVLWLRPFIVYGAGQQGNMLIPYALRQAGAGAPAHFSDGQQRRDFVHVADVAEAFLAAIHCQAAGFRAVNLGRGEAVVVADVLRHLEELVRPRPVFHIGAIARRPGEPAVQVADTRTAQDLLGWRAGIGWRDGLRSVVAATRAPERRSA